MMKKYNAKIDNGQCGETTIIAENINDALIQAIDWAESGDWPDNGCTIDVCVEDENGNCECKEVYIESEEEKKDRELNEDGELIATNESEYETDKIIVIDNDAYLMKSNGGKRGAHSSSGNIFPDVLEPTKQIDQSQARCLMLDWGYDIAEVARKTRNIDN